MKDRASRLWVAVLITAMDSAVSGQLVGGIWPVWSESAWIRSVLILTIILWTSSAAILWLHVAFDFLACQLERRGASLRSCGALPHEGQRPTNV